MKIISFYLPQYHRIKENDEWWGEGYTEWTNVKLGKPYLKNQNQPRVPYKNNYYNLNEDFKETFTSQMEMAKKYGIYGFCFYHYWFKDGKKLLEKPVEKFLEDKSLDMPFCMCWANEPWTRVWDGSDKEVIMPQEYGDEKEWTDHFMYLLPYLKDDRYIKLNGRPLLVIYRPEIIPELERMLNCWERLSDKFGLSKPYFVAQGIFYANSQNKSKNIDSYILYEPGYTQNSISRNDKNSYSVLLKNPVLSIDVIIQHMKVKIAKFLKLKSFRMLSYIFDYDLFWRWIIKRKVPEKKVFLGAFVDWDNTARRKEKGARLFKNVSPQKFGNYMEELIKKAKRETNQDMIFVNAWNEWGEGTYLEPDEKYGFQYLEAIKNALEKNDEYISF